MEEQTVSESNLKHTTFDFALFLELPQHTPQVRPLYVKFCFCVQLFGVCDEAGCRQVNFIFHERRPWAKMVHAFMLQMLCCPGSIITLITTLRSESWRCMPTTALARIKIGPPSHTLPVGVIVSFTDEVSLSFRTVGQTRCSVDGYFTLMTKSLWSNDDCETMINESC